MNEKTPFNFISDVRGEISAAREKFPSPDASMCALTEEIVGLAKAMMEENKQRVWEEAVQVATMAARVAIEGDPTLDGVRRRRGADLG